MREGLEIKPEVYIISDSVGETAEFVVRAAASQFDAGAIKIYRFPYVTGADQVTPILDQAAQRRAVVAYTLVWPQLRNFLVEQAAARQVVAVDILGPMINALAQVSDTPPQMEPGLLRRLDDAYFRRMEAIEFAVRYDGGKDPRGLLFADVVLIGISRTSKTPVCMYLAHRMIKAANVPLVPEVTPPEELFKIPVAKIIGLTIEPRLLTQIRQERLKSMGLIAKANYADLARILQEVDFAGRMMKELGCQVIDVTNKAIEETAGRVMEIYRKEDD